MSVVVRSRGSGFPVESWQAPAEKKGEQSAATVKMAALDIWTAIQSQKAADPLPAAPYVHPLVRRSSSSLSQKSLEVCTESLGSETGSDAFSSSDEMGYLSSAFSSDVDDADDEAEDVQEEHKDGEEVQEDDEEEKYCEKKELATVNYHCCISRRSPPRSYPPPLPSISRRDGPCLSMRPHRCDGRLIVQAVPVPSSNYLHAERQGGRLLLSFIHTNSPDTRSSTAETTNHIPDPGAHPKVEQQEEEEKEVEELVEEEEEEEEEVEVVDRGTVVEVKVRTQQQPQNGAMKVHRSSLVINKFVGGTPLADDNQESAPPPPPTQTLRRVPSTTTTAAAAAVAASTLSAATSLSDHEYYNNNNNNCNDQDHQYDGRGLEAAAAEYTGAADSKLLFTSKSRNREELLHHMRRCSQLRRPLFFWEPYCIATSS